MIVLASVLSTGCPLANEELNLYRCYKDEDCFTREGEFCGPLDRRFGKQGECMQRDAGSPDSTTPDGPGGGDGPGDLNQPLEGGPDLSWTDSAGDTATSDVATSDATD